MREEVERASNKTKRIGGKFKVRATEEQKRYMKEYYQMNKEKKKEYMKKRYEENRVEILQRMKKLRQRPEIKEWRKEYDKKYWQKNKKRRLEQSKEYNKKRRKIDRVWARRQDIKRITITMFGPSKKYWCVLCKSLDKEVSAVEWHHYTNPYQFDRAIPLCKFHHNKF